MIEQGLSTLLRGDATVAGLVGVCVYPVVLPEDTQYPCLTYQLASSSHDYSVEAAVVSDKRFQFDAWGNTYANTKAVLHAVRGVLDAFQGTLSDGTVVLATPRGVEIDFWESASRVYRSTVEYSLTVSES